MPSRSLSNACLAPGALMVLAALVTHPEPGRTVGHPGAPAAVLPGRAVSGCDIMIVWHTYRGSIDYNRSQVRVRGLTWRSLRGGGGTQVVPPPPETRTNGRIWNWREELAQERCDRLRRYRFLVVAPDSTAEPVRSNEPYAGNERWLYVPSTTGWTEKTTIDVGYLDWCVIDGTKCSKPYYPSGPTPVLEW